jgi:hypothetical protein
MDTRDVRPTASRRLLIRSFLLLLGLLAAPAASARQPKAVTPKAEVPKVQIRGTVVDDDDKPVAGATVSGVAVMTTRQGQHTFST